MFTTKTIKQGDCLDVLKEYPDNHFDLILTSPPYADARAKTYGGVPADEYVEWWLPRSEEFLRVLKPTGTFILNIKEKVVNGERSTYVMELIIAMRKQGWFWTEEFIWHKKTAFPGKWPNRFRDSWERCLQFNKNKKFKMNQDAVMIPIGDWATKRMGSLSENDKKRNDSDTQSGFSKRTANWKDRDMVYPTNVLHLAPETGNKKHSAAFPKALPEWFIKLFTDKDDNVLDPFVGSGTTCRVAQSLNRNSVGIDILEENVDLANDTMKNCEFLIFT